MLYILLQLAFLVAIPHSLLAHGWRDIDFTSPFGQLALAVNLGWLSSLLYVDAVISPSGSEFVGTAEAARQTYALAKNRLLPKYFLSVPGKSGVPRRALLFNFVLGLLVLIPLHSWITLVTYLSDVFVLTYAVSAVAAGTFRSAAPTGYRGGYLASSGSRRSASSCPPRSLTGPAGPTCGSPSRSPWPAWSCSTSCG